MKGKKHTLDQIIAKLREEADPMARISPSVPLLRVVMASRTMFALLLGVIGYASYAHACCGFTADFKSTDTFLPNDGQLQGKS